MRSNIKKLTTMVGVTLALALIGNAPAFAATKHRTHEPPARASHARATTSDQNGTTGQADMDRLPGYSARPAGMCWDREGGGGHDLSGYWHACNSGGR